MATWNEQITGSNTSHSQTGYAPTFYPGTADSGLASPLVVNAGQEVSGVGFAIASTRVATIAGRVIDASGQPVGSTTVFLQQGTRAQAFAIGGVQHFARTNRDGIFKIADVAPGTYTLSARQGQPNTDDAESGSVQLTVGGTDLLGVTVALSHGATITGSVSIDGDQKAPFTPQSVLVQARPNETSWLGSQVASGRLDDSCQFQLKGLTGSQLLYAANLPDGWAVKSISVNGQDITDSGFDFTGQSSVSGVQIVLTNKLTDITGIATDEDNKPLTEYTLVIFPVDQQRWQPRSIRLLRPDQNGRFELKGLRPGDYYAAVVASIEQGSQDDPDLLRQLSRDATKFSLTEGESKTLNLVEQQQ